MEVTSASKMLVTTYDT